MCEIQKDNKNEKGKGDEEMTTNIKPKPIKSMELNFETEKEYKEFIDYVENPPPASEFVKKIIKKYQEQSDNK